MNPLLEAALGYAARGIPVYPVHWPRPTPGGGSLVCSCPRGRCCDRPAKHPLVWHGVNDASRDPAQLQRWWQRWPDANIGLATGIIFDALDLDGLAGLAALRQQAPTAGRRHPGPLVATGGGGWHYWYAPSGFGNRPPRGLSHVDWRGLGGSVLAPPSRHASGGRYRWLRTLDQAPLPEVPAALRALPEPQRPPASPSPPGGFRPAELGHPYARQALAAELGILQQAPATRGRWPGCFGRVGRLQHRPRTRPAGRPAGVRHGPGRAGPHHPPAHATGRPASRTPGPSEPAAEPVAAAQPAHRHRPGDHPAHEAASPDQDAPARARARVRAAYQAQLAAGQTPTGAGLARAAGVSERYGQRLLAELTADPVDAAPPNGNHRVVDRRPIRTHREHP